jgi:hypothetical protein
MSARDKIGTAAYTIGPLPGTGSDLIPLVDISRSTIEHSVDKDMIKDSPSVDPGKPLSPEQAPQGRRLLLFI